MLAQGGAATVRASALEALVRADAGATAVLASAPHAVVLADASPPTFPTFAFLAVVLADAEMPMPPQILQRDRWRLCGHLRPRCRFLLPSSPSRACCRLQEGSGVAFHVSSADAVGLVESLDCEKG